jgi:hypothetical protein
MFIAFFFKPSIILVAYLCLLPARFSTKADNFELYFLRVEYILWILRVRAPEPCEKNIYHHYFYYIAASQAHLIKNLPALLGALKGKECVWKLASSSVQCMLTYLILFWSLSVETSELRHVPWVWFVLPCLLVLQSVCSSWNYFGYYVWPHPWRLEFFVAFLLEPKN